MESREIVLDGRKFVIGYALATDALTAAAIYSNAFAPMIDGVRRAQGQTPVNRKLAGIAEVMAQPGLAQYARQLCLIFGKCTQVIEGDKSFSLVSESGIPGSALNTAIFDRVFAGKIVSMWKWLDAAIEHNLSDFLAELRAKVAEIEPAIFGSKSPESSPKNGSSGSSFSPTVSA